MQPMSQHRLERKTIDPISWPVPPSLRSGGRLSADRLYIGPMGREARALFDPFSQSSYLVLGKWLAKLGRRHPLVLVGARHAANQFASLRFSRHDRNGAGIQFAGRDFRIVQPQPGLALSIVGTMTRVAFVRKNRPDIPIEV